MSLEGEVGSAVRLLQCCLEAVLVLPGYTEVNDAVYMSNMMSMVECFGR